MNFYARARASLLSWTHETPLPTADSKWYPKFQSWHHFHLSLQQWVAITDNDTRDHTEPPRDDDEPSDLVLLTWNIDATSARTEDRVTDIITFVTQLDPGVRIVFLQEVSKAALQQILKDERIRRSWISSEQDDTAWGKQSFATITLLSKARFASTALGPVWRVAYPSHFDRDALCCDIFVSFGRERSPTRVRLVNVHLDSLPIKPSHRPRQISIISSFLRSAGCGLVAGDFNPVLEEDATLLESNGLTDIKHIGGSAEPPHGPPQIPDFTHGRHSTLERSRRIVMLVWSRWGVYNIVMLIRGLFLAWLIHFITKRFRHIYFSHIQLLFVLKAFVVIYKHNEYIDISICIETFNNGVNWFLHHDYHELFHFPIYLMLNSLVYVPIE
ncbi:hypothetical protein AFLA_003969 [Aspergillus flavus NRRL3357]|nr:hypothetical protein AFLA_003969 [Aspergillus flavus NRRL3357]